ncbi:MAG: HAD-IA family hydrolase [Oscillospiraceae bacterium]|nr:HAD-IA family hydrolase [Oscillospiraceae bacterium]
MQYRTILFDLDGTLTDPFEGITKSVQYAAQHFGIIEPDLEKLRGFIGPPLEAELCRYFHLSPEDGKIALAKYRERFSTIGIFENKVYPGIRNMLSALHERGATLAIASSKPHIYVNQILEHFDLAKYFKAVSGSELSGERVVKSDAIRYALELLELEPSPEILMVGDRVHDAIGAFSVGLPFVGVRYSYAVLDEFDSVANIFVADTVEQLSDFLLK